MQRNYSCLEVAALLHITDQLFPARQSDLTSILFTVKQFGLMLLFTFELKYTRMYNTTDVTPFMFGCSPVITA